MPSNIGIIMWMFFAVKIGASSGISEKFDAWISPTSGIASCLTNHQNSTHRTAVQEAVVCLQLRL